MRIPIPSVASVRRPFAEFLGTMLLLVAVVGSGIMADRLAGGNAAVALLCNTVATAAALYALIGAFGPVSADFNPLVTLFRRGSAGAVWSILAQFGGAWCGVRLAHAMFGLPLAQVSARVRDSAGERIGEVVATAGLLFTIKAVSRSRPGAVPAAVAAWIAGAYWFTSSTSFANPAVTWARSLTDTFAGVRPADVLPFFWAQLAGAALGAAAARILFGPAPKA